MSAIPKRASGALRATLRPLVRGLKRRVAARVIRSEALSGLYYAVRPSSFGREHRAVLAGIQRYRRLDAEGRQRYLLRRNIHMLEKGLSMRPRRETFALNYIGATVNRFQQLTGEIGGSAGTDRELQWASDVLTTFFEVAGDHPTIQSARSNFVCAPRGVDDRSPNGLSPYQRDIARAAPVRYEDLLTLAERRRSVRWFEQREVPRELILQATEVASLSPSACNRQPFEFRVFDDPESVQRVAEIPMGTRGWVHNIPTFVVIVGTLSAFFDERDRHLIYTDGCLAAMSFLLALETLGLSSCCVNWPDIAEREHRMAEVLGLGPDERPVMCVAVGYPDPAGLVPFSQKRAADQLARFGSV